MMKLPELKRRTRKVWESLNAWKDGVVLQPENFEKEVKSIGDRRYKKTWIKALARFKAAQLHRSCLDAWTLITISFNYHPGRWDYEYRYEIVDEFLLYPDGLELIRAGLEQIFATEDFSNKEREDTHGFLKLLEEREAQHRGVSITARPQRAIAGTYAARKRVTGAIVFRRFTQSIQDNGGDEQVYPEAISAETIELFDCDVKDLYEQTGGKPGRRDTLPQPAQEAYMVNESLSANELERLKGTIGGETQEEVNDQIKAVVREQSKQTRKWLPW